MNVPRLLFVFTTVSAVVGGSFVVGVYSGVRRNAASEFVHDIYSSIREALGAVKETSLLEPDHLLQPSRGQGAGVTVNLRASDGALVLLSGFFGKTNELRLVQRDGSVVRRWPVSFSKLFPDVSHMPENARPATDWNIDLHGALALPDGSVVFNFEHGGLTKLDRCGGTVWTLARRTHHSVETAEGGGFWVAGRRQHAKGSDSPFPPFVTPFDDDLVLRVSDDGKVQSEFSVPGLFYENGLAAVLTATGDKFRKGRVWDEEIIHLNKIAELPTATAAQFPMFEAGDLLLSLRERNMLLVVDPDSHKVKWWQIGPWVRQHDPQFARNGWLTVFNNNAYEHLEGYRLDLSLPRSTNILAMNPATRETVVLFGGRPGQEMLSVLRGKQMETSSGLFITESEAGRVIETDANGQIVWEYVNSHDDENVGEITQARLYPKDYFAVADWSCAETER